MTRNMVTALLLLCQSKPHDQATVEAVSRQMTLGINVRGLQHAGDIYDSVAGQVGRRDDSETIAALILQAERLS